MQKTNTGEVPANKMNVLKNSPARSIKNMSEANTYLPPFMSLNFKFVLCPFSLATLLTKISENICNSVTKTPKLMKTPKIQRYNYY